MRFIAWFEISWVDEFLILSEDVESLLIPKKDIWYPDISIYDTVEDPQTISDGQHVILFQDGRVSWYPGNEYVTRCSIDIRRYPFDDQVCNLRVGAWHTTAWTQQLTDSGKGLDISNYVENGEWEITRTMVEANKSPGYNTSWIRYHIYLKRRSLHPILNTLAPVVMLSFLNTLVFLLPANSGEKVTLCISVLLSFTVFLTVFNDTMPKMSTTISYLSIYLVVQLGMSVFGIVMSIYIWRMKDREDNKYHFVNVSANKNEEEINRSVYTKSEDLKDHSISLRLQGYKDGIEENIAIGESSKTEGCQGDESDFHFFNSNYSNGFLRKESSRKTRYSAAVFPSPQKYNIDEKDADDPNRKIKKLDMIINGETDGINVDEDDEVRLIESIRKRRNESEDNHVTVSMADFVNVDNNLVNTAEISEDDVVRCVVKQDSDTEEAEEQNTAVLSQCQH
ncbi:neuronal acetylcholine receptor subunit alpha-3-like [Ylistrum balloti]|uniref:neuronal acetylcholine receptor subunit alpha-3-like n=1 Tax=Ylistrum balloti TaxID=509963 RepID=UPI002905E706|nr:neuronal acetylcholine receptor subunit alpha-3-like [Ylistrum balloti]